METTDDVTQGLTNVMHCPKCKQRFYLKSNLEVHVLFCDNKSTSETKNVGDVIAKSNTPSQQSNSQGTAPTDDQTFEYIPPSDSQKCVSCSQRFPEGAVLGGSLTDVAQLLAHSRKKIVSDKVELYECEECDREFLYKHPDIKSLTKVLAPVLKKERNDTKKFKCSICSRGFDFENDMFEHEVKHANTPSRYACASCSEKFVTRDMLQQHYDSQENNCRPRKCDICNRVFVHANHLRRHLSVHAGIKPFVCTICRHEFNQKSDLQRHEKRHTVDGKLSCSKCIQEFTKVEDLREHVKVHKKVDNVKQTFTCEKCSKIFGRRSHYKRHMSVHEGVKPYSCEQCGKAFNQRTDLKRHHISHLRRDMKSLGDTSLVNSKSTEEEHICCVCNKVFNSRAAIVEHDIVHQKIMNTGVFY